MVKDMYERTLLSGAATAGQVPTADGSGAVTWADKWTAGAAETPLNAAYAAGDLDTEGEVIAAINAIGTTVNSLITKLQALGLLA